MHRPTRRIAGMAVQMISRRVLPWIGGPSSQLLARPHAELPHREEHDGPTSTKTGIDAISRTSHSVSIGLACSEASTGTSRWRCRRRSPGSRRRCRSPSIWTPVRARVRALGCPGAAVETSPQAPWGGILCERADERGAGAAGASPPGQRLGCAVDRVQPVGREARLAARARRRGSPTARRPGGGGTPWRTGRAGGSRPGGRPRARSGSGWRASPPPSACGPGSGGRGTWSAPISA